MKTRTWILILAAVLVACVALSIFALWPREADCAQIYSDGKLLYTLDLRVDRTVTVENGKGINIITVQGGKIAVTDANCPDGYCMGRGFCNGGTQIVCLPNRLEIRFMGQQEIDGAVG